MKQLKLLVVMFVLTACAGLAPAADKPESGLDSRMKSFREAKFGMFIHWGLYAIPARGEWVMCKEKIPVEKYTKYAAEFNPVKFNAEEWVRMAKDAGMKYMVITSKHHDGFAMFGTKVTPFNIVEATPFKRDPLKELAAACRKEGIQLGFYYSQAQDWHHPGGAASKGSWDPAQKGNFEGYLEKIAMLQVKELLTGYGPVFAIWFDTPAQMTPPWVRKFAELVHTAQPATLINSRLLYSGRAISTLKDGELNELKELGVDYLSYADRQIPQQPQWRDWETCMTLNNSWGYTKADENWKTPEVLIGQLMEIASKGGNFLLNVGPTAEGEIPAPSVRNLKAVGDWLKINGEAVYGAGPSPFGAEFGKISAKEKDQKTGKPLFVASNEWRCTTRPGKLYFTLLKWPAGKFTVAKLNGKAEKAYLLADPEHKPLGVFQDGGTLTVSLPDAPAGSQANVLCVEMAKQ